MTDRLWVLGAPDPEMAAIEALLLECGERITYAADARGVRVHPGIMYAAESLICADSGNHPCTSGVRRVCLVECELLSPGVDPEPGEDCCHAELAGRDVVRIDHHRPGDPGYGRPPAEFFPASSIGQVCAALGVAIIYAHRDDACRVLAESEGYHGWHADWSGIGHAPSGVVAPGANRWTTGKRGLWSGAPAPEAWARVTLEPLDALRIAAADHCLGAAYRGECPGVDAGDLREWRIATQASFRGVAVDVVRSEIEAAEAEIRRSPDVYVGADNVPAPEKVRDMRRRAPIPSLPEAATYLGVGYISGPLIGPDGRHKYTVSGTSGQVRAWMEIWAPSQGITGIYGDPARGFGGGYAEYASADAS